MVQPGPIRVALDAHVVGRRGTGNETYIVNLVNALATRSDVEPLVFVDGNAVWPGTIEPPLHRLRTRTPFARIPIELPIAVRRAGAAALHVQYVAPPFAGLPVVTTIHDVSFEDVPGLFRLPTELRLKTFVRRSARRSASVVTISEFTKARLIHHYGLDPDRIFVTPLAVADHWRPLESEERFRRLRGLDLTDPFVLAVGNLHPRKNLPRLIRAVAAVRRAGLDDLCLVLVGQRGWRAEEVDAAVEAVDGSAWVRFAGRRSRLTPRLTTRTPGSLFSFSLCFGDTDIQCQYSRRKRGSRIDHRSGRPSIRGGPPAPMFRYRFVVDRNQALDSGDQSSAGAEQVANARCILGVVARDLAEKRLRAEAARAAPRTRS